MKIKELDPNDPEQDGICQDLDSTVLSHECPARFLSVKEEDIVVWVDPLDGTKEFALGSKLYLYLSSPTNQAYFKTHSHYMLVRSA